MRNYPKMIKNLYMVPAIEKISRDIDSSHFVLSGTIDEEKGKVIFHYADDTTDELGNVEHNFFTYLPYAQKRQLESLRKPLSEAITSGLTKYNRNITLDDMMISFGGIFGDPSIIRNGNNNKMFDEVIQKSLYSLEHYLKTDIWFLEHSSEVRDYLSKAEHLKKLSSQAVMVIRKDKNFGGISLNNIEQIPSPDLNSIKVAIRESEYAQMKEQKKAKRKEYRLRGK